MLQSLSCPSHGVVASRSSWSVWSAGETHLRSLERIFQLGRSGFCCVDLFVESRRFPRRIGSDFRCLIYWCSNGHHLPSTVHVAQLHTALHLTKDLSASCTSLATRSLWQITSTPSRTTSKDMPRSTLSFEVNSAFHHRISPSSFGPWHGSSLLRQSSSSSGTGSWGLSLA